MYRVVYYRMGRRMEDEFRTLAEAELDFEEKLRIDLLQVMDDRFVWSVEDGYRRILRTRSQNREGST